MQNQNLENGANHETTFESKSKRTRVYEALAERYEQVVEDTCVIRICDHDEWGFTDKAGNVLRKPQFYFLESFKKKFARVREPKKMHWGLVSAGGRLTIKTEYEELFGLDKGWPYLIARNLSGKYGVLSYNGEVIVPFDYDEADRFSEDIRLKAGGKWYTLYKKQ